jgi:plastocyanin
MIARRHFLAAGGAALAGLLLPAVRRTWAGSAEIHMRSDRDGTVVGFDPVGLMIEPGQTVRWVCDANVHSVSAYHPDNDNHSLRIPEAARPWASDYLQPGEHFAVTFTVAGAYDYYCTPHEAAGMVGRIIVGRPGGPATLPFDYFVAQGRDWLPVPEAAQRAFPAIDTILARRIVPSPLSFA